jgi:hypothetical protein
MDPKFAAMFVLFAIAFVVFPTLVLRYRRLELRHQERMVAFDKGIPVPQETIGTPPTIETYHLRGLVWLAAGIGLSLALFIVVPIVSSDSPENRLYRMQELRRIGFSSDEVRDAMREYDSQRYRSRSLSALGLVPAAVGVAYLFFYYEQKRRYLYDPPARPVKME